MKRISLLALTLQFSACGSLPFSEDDKKKNNAKGGANVSGTLGVTSENVDGLPTCGPGNQGALGYVTSEQAIYTCGADGAWAPVTIKGEKGDPGDAGPAGDKGDPATETATVTAFSLYKKHRMSIYRISVACIKKDTACTETNSKQYTGGFGSGFLCGEGRVCTNKHLFVCSPPSDLDFKCEYKLGKVAMHALPEASDSLMVKDEAGKQVLKAPFYEADPADIAYHASRDLAVLKGVTPPAGATPVTLSTKNYLNSAKVLDPILSLSFPLGFTDLYTDLGALNSPTLGQCPDGESKYGCIGAYYDFSTTNDTDNGSSGSPLFNVTTGEVVGVTSAGTFEENANYTWAIDASLLKSIE